MESLRMKSCASGFFHSAEYIGDEPVSSHSAVLCASNFVFCSVCVYHTVLSSVEGLLNCCQFLGITAKTFMFLCEHKFSFLYDHMASVC